MLLIFGYALSLDVDHIPTIVYNLDDSAPEPRADAAISAARDISTSSGRCTVTVPSNERWIRGALLVGRGDPGGFFEQHLAGEHEAQVQLLLDGSDSNTAAIAQGYAEGMIANLRGTHCAAMRKACTAVSVPRSASSAECASGTTPTWFRATSSCPD